MWDLNTILLVDDSAAIRSGLRREFERAGWVVCGEAENGQEAILTLVPEIHGDRRVVDRFSQPQSRAGSR